MRPSQNRPSPISACFLSIEKLVKGQTQSEKGENAERKENSEARQYNNTLAIKQSQGPLAPPQGLQIIV